MVTIVYDNYPLDKRLKTSWGFACVVEGLSKTILFDTGGRGQVLLSNMEAAGFEPAQIDCVVLSHIHGDHTGGLEAFLQVNSNVNVFLPRAFPSRFKRAVRASDATIVETEDPCQVCERAWTTGVLSRGIEEQGIYVKNPQGLIVITGCAHPGIVPIAQAANKHADSPVYAVLGGFHMAGASDREVAAVVQGLKETGVQKVSPCHCSGDRTRSLMNDVFAQGYLASGVGARLVFRGEQ